MRGRGMRALLGFFLLPLIATAASLVAIPFLISVSGTDGWAAVAIGQGIGITSALVVAFGWQTVGPAEVARLAGSQQRQLYWDSVVMRSILLLVVAPVSVLASLALVGAGNEIAASLVALAFAAQGMSPSWYLTGQSRPFMIAAVETGPRAAGQFAAIGAVAWSKSLEGYGITLLAVEVCIAAVGFIMFARRSPEAESSTRARVAAQFRAQWPLALSALAGAGYTRAAVPLIAAVAFPAVPVFAAVDRAQTFARTALRPLAMFFQSWVVREDLHEQWKRGTRALVATVSVALVIGIALAVGLPTIGWVLFTHEVTISWAQSVLAAVAIVFVAGSMSTGLYFLVPMRQVAVFSVTSIVGSLVGVPLLLILSQNAGATGAVGAVAAVEGLVLVIQLIYVWKLRPSTQGS